MPAVALASLLPMRLKLVRELPQNARDYLFEPKWDGYRCVVAFIDERGGVRLQSKQLKPLTPLFPELRGLGRAVGRRAVIDGEIVALGDDGKPSFSRLQARSGLNHGTQAGAPVTFIAFDSLTLDVSVRHRPRAPNANLI